MTAGAPSTYNQETADAICALLTMGWSLRKVNEYGYEEYPDIKFPSLPTVFKWMRDNEEFLKQYTRAKQESADAMAEEILDIADKAENQIMGIDKSDGARIQAQKLRIDTRKFIMAKMKPKKYGEKLDLTSDGERLIQAPIIVSEIKNRNAKPEAKAKTSG